MATAVATHETVTTKVEWPYFVELIQIKPISPITDDRYQRPLNQTLVKQIVREFDPILVGTLDVNARKDGTLAIMDGQQRLEALRRLGITEAWACVYALPTVGDEADFFYRKNHNRRSVKPYYAFQARLLAGDEEAHEINAVLNGRGYRFALKTNEATGEIGSVSMLLNAFKMFGKETMGNVLQAVRKPQRDGSLSGLYLGGIGHFMRHNPGFDPNGLMTVIRDYEPKVVIGLARAQRVGSRDFYTSGGVIKDLYNQTVTPDRVLS